MSGNTVIGFTCYSSDITIQLHKIVLVNVNFWPFKVILLCVLFSGAVILWFWSSLIHVGTAEVPLQSKSGFLHIHTVGFLSLTR